MPKKSRKMKERAAMRRAMISDSMSEAIDPSEASRTTLSPAARASTQTTFDYTHIYSDLKRIAFFAAIFFAVLIGLSFVIK